MTVSNMPPSPNAGTPLATAAFASRAPSRWTAIPSSRAVSTVARSSSSGQTPPPALLWVSSSATTDTRGLCSRS